MGAAGAAGTWLCHGPRAGKAPVQAVELWALQELQVSLVHPALAARGWGAWQWGHRPSVGADGPGSGPETVEASGVVWCRHKREAHAPVLGKREAGDVHKHDAPAGQVQGPCGRVQGVHLVAGSCGGLRVCLGRQSTADVRCRAAMACSAARHGLLNRQMRRRWSPPGALKTKAHACDAHPRRRSPRADGARPAPHLPPSWRQPPGAAAAAPPPEYLQCIPRPTGMTRKRAAVVAYH